MTTSEYPAWRAIAAEIRGVAAFRLCVWRPVQTERELHYAEPDTGNLSGDESGPIVRTPFSREQLHEQVYSWAATEDVWSGVPDEQLREELRVSLIDRFQPSRPPGDRGLEGLRQAIAALRVATDGPGAHHWTACGQVEDGAGEPVFLRGAPLFSLLGHLTWVYETFKDVPHLSVTVR